MDWLPYWGGLVIAFSVGVIATLFWLGRPDRRTTDRD